MDGSAWAAAASITVAIIAAGSAELSRRAAAKAARENKVAESRTEIEKGAYDRAEALLDRQFKRQEEEIEGLHADVVRLHADADRLNHRVRQLEVEREEDRVRHAAEREEDRRLINQRDEQIRTYAALLAARGIDLP